MDGAFPTIDLSVLTPWQREVVEMRYCSNMSWRAIAILLGISHQTVMEHHSAALRRLRQSINPATSPHKVDA